LEEKIFWPFHQCNPYHELNVIHGTDAIKAISLSIQLMGKGNQKSSTLEFLSLTGAIKILE
jgi:uncharacterized protein with GYD domain